MLRRDVAAGDAQIRAVDLAAGLELGDHVGRGLDRDGEADALVAAALALDLGVDPDHLAGAVDQGAARVAGIDRGVGLDDVADREAVGCLDLALERRDDATRHRPVECERVTDRDDRVAHLHLRGVAQRQRVHSLGVVDLEQGDVTGWIGPDDLGLLRVAVSELDVHTLRALDDVGVGEDVALVVDQEARTGGGALLLLGESEDGLGLLHDLRPDEGDALGVALVDLMDRQALVLRAACGASESRGRDHCGRGRTLRSCRRPPTRSGSGRRSGRRGRLRRLTRSWSREIS